MIKKLLKVKVKVKETIAVAQPVFAWAWHNKFSRVGFLPEALLIACFLRISTCSKTT